MQAVAQFIGSGDTGQDDRDGVAVLHIGKTQVARLTRNAHFDIVEVFVRAGPADHDRRSGGGVGRGVKGGKRQRHWHWHWHRHQHGDRDGTGTKDRKCPGADREINGTHRGHRIGPGSEPRTYQIAGVGDLDRQVAAGDGPGQRVGKRGLGRVIQNGGQGDSGQCRGFGFRVWQRVCHHFAQRRQKLIGIRSRAQQAAGFIGQALHLPQSFGVGDVETDHMHGEINPGLFQSHGSGARVGVAGFDPVGNQDHRRLVLGIAQGFRRRDHRIGHRRLAHRGDPGHGGGNRVAGVGAGCHQVFDIGAIAPAAVAIDRQPEVLVVGQALQQFGDDVAGDDDLVHPVNLPPHRP